MSAPLLHTAMVRWLHEMTMAGVFTTDTALVIQSWNTWLEKATGRSEASVVGRPLFEVFADANPDILGAGEGCCEHRR